MGVKFGWCFFGLVVGCDGFGIVIVVIGVINWFVEVINWIESYYYNEESCIGKIDSYGICYII